MGHLRDKLERRARETARPGVPPDPWARPANNLLWLSGVRDAILRLKATDPDAILAEVWRLERECDDLAREAVERMAADEGGMPALIERMLADIDGRRGPGDGGELDIRPRRGGDGR